MDVVLVLVANQVPLRLHLPQIGRVVLVVEHLMVLYHPLVHSLVEKEKVLLVIQVQMM